LQQLKLNHRLKYHADRLSPEVHVVSKTGSMEGGNYSTAANSSANTSPSNVNFQLENLLNDNKNKATRINDLQRYIEDCQNQIAYHTQHSKVLSLEKAELEALISKKVEENVSLSNELQFQRAQLLTKTIKLGDIESQLHKYSDHIDDLQEQIGSLQQQNQALLTSATTVAPSEEDQQHIAYLQGEIKKLEDDCKLYDEKYNELELHYHGAINETKASFMQTSLHYYFLKLKYNGVNAKLQQLQQQQSVPAVASGESPAAAAVQVAPSKGLSPLVLTFFAVFQLFVLIVISQILLQ
jgi:chromosome segregation ATPase